VPVATTDHSNDTVVAMDRLHVAIVTLDMLLQCILDVVRVSKATSLTSSTYAVHILLRAVVVGAKHLSLQDCRN
jgi:hypothetical protein